MKHPIVKAFLCSAVASAAFVGSAHSAEITCGTTYSVVGGDTLSHISMLSYGSPLYQPIYTANIDTIGSNPDRIFIGQSLSIPCLSSDATVLSVSAENDDGAVDGALVFTFNRASAPPFIINSGIVDAYLADITEATEGRVTFIDPEVVNRNHADQFALVTSGQVDGAYVLNSTIAESHPLLQLPMYPMLGGSAEQTAVALWRMHDEYLAQTDYFSDAQLLGFIAAPAAHIWRDASMPVTPDEDIVTKNEYAVPYFMGLDTRGPAVMRADMEQRTLAQRDIPPAYFMAHGAALATGLWNEDANVSVMEVDNGAYTPTFSVVLSNDAWMQISPADQNAIQAISGEALSYRSAAWDEFDNAFRSRMMDMGLDFVKADKPLLDNLWKSSFPDLAAWIADVDSRGVSGTMALNSYLKSLRSLEGSLIYRGQETYVDQHPFFTGGN